MPEAEEICVLRDDHPALLHSKGQMRFVNRVEQARISGGCHIDSVES
jgi:hypothetical protein